jgi:hypothetical protein
MIRETIEIGVIVERRRLNNPWADHAWMPTAVLVGSPAAAPWTVLDETPDVTRYYAGSFLLEIFETDTGDYRDNILSGQPSLWVVLGSSDEPPGVAIRAVTANPAEGEALTEPGTDIVEAVAMPPAIQTHLAAFVEAHHVERPFIKRKRDRANPEALAARPRGSHIPDEDK